MISKTHPKNKKFLLQNKTTQIQKASQGTIVPQVKEEWLPLFTFGGFISDKYGDTPYSATVDIYDAAPKFFYRNRRDSTTNIQEIKRTVEFKHHNQIFSATIKGAIIKSLSGEDICVFPGQSEEIIEDAIRKIAIDNNMIVNNQGMIGVKFKLYDLYKMLKEAKSTRSYSQIRESLQIMAETQLTIAGVVQGKVVSTTANLFTSLSFVRDIDNEIDGDEECTVIFHPLVTSSFMSNSHRLAHYRKIIKYRHNLARKLHKRITHNFTTANFEQKIYRISMQTLCTDAHITHRRSKGETFSRCIKPALEELICSGFITSYKTIDNENKSDLIIHLFLTEDTIQEIIKANHHKKETNERMERLKTLLYEGPTPSPRPLPKN